MTYTVLRARDTFSHLILTTFSSNLPNPTNFLILQMRNLRFREVN